MGLYRVINMGVPVLIGVCQQASDPAPPPKTITINRITFNTVGYGTTTGTPITPIPVSEQIATTLDSGNSFTFPTDSLAQYYSNSNPDQQVFTSFVVSWTPDNFVENDLPSDGENQIGWEFNTFSQRPPASGIWFLEGNETGSIEPSNTKVNGVRILTPNDLNRADVYETSPLVGDVNTASGGCSCFIVTLGGSENNNTDRLNKVAFASDASIGETTFLLTVRIRLKDGSFATGTQTITVSENAVKENLTGGSAAQPTIEAVRTRAILQSPSNSTFPQVEIPEEDQVLALMQAGNSFTAPANSMLNITDEENEYTGSHTLQVFFDTSSLTPSDFPEEMTVRYVITTTEPIGANQIAFLQEDLRTQTINFFGLARDSILGEEQPISGPTVLLDNQAMFKISTDLNSQTWQIRVELEKADETFQVGANQTITMLSNSVKNL